MRRSWQVTFLVLYFASCNAVAHKRTEQIVDGWWHSCSRTVRTDIDAECERIENVFPNCYHARLQKPAFFIHQGDAPSTLLWVSRHSFQYQVDFFKSLFILERALTRAPPTRPVYVLNKTIL